MSEAARLSRILWLAREAVEMHADCVESQLEEAALAERDLIAEIDAYRAEQGWNPDGFGFES